MPTKIALIGTGAIAHTHAKAIKDQGDAVQLAAVMDVDRARLDAFSEEYHVPRTYTDADALFAAEKPDLVHICTPPGLHAALSIQAMRAGAWVLCEKPICGSLAEFDQITAVERETGMMCSSVFQWRFGSAGQHFKRLVDAGDFGRAMVGVCNTTWYRDEAYYAVPWRGKWSTELGGPTMGHGIHAMDFFLYQLGPWREVTAMMGTLFHNIEVEDVSMAMVKFESGAMGSIVNSVLSPRQETLFRFDFEYGSAELRELYAYNNKDWTFTAIPGPDAAAREARWRDIGGDVRSTTSAQLGHLLHSKAAGERPLVSGPNLRLTIEFLSALYKSAVTGKPVRCGEIVPGDPFYTRMCGDPAPRFGR